MNINDQNMRTLLLCLLAILCYATLHAQQIKGIVQDEQGKPLTGSSVSLKKSKDSSVVKLEITNAEGKYAFPDIPAGKYFVTVSHIGYSSRNTTEINTGDQEVTYAPDLALAKEAASLQEATITAHKPLIEVKPDRIILNVEGSINAAGSDAIELLRKSPGVTLDKDNNISLNGKNGVQIFIDGRPTPLNGTDLTEYLKNLQSSSIEAIEIISNPSAKYEAEGSGGIINIRLKKDKSMGTNGSVNAGYQVGTFAKYNAGFSFNHRDRNINVFGNYSYNHSLNESYSTMYRSILDTLFNQHAVVDNTVNKHNFKAGMDYFIDRQNTIGVVVNGTVSNNNFESKTSTPISYLPTEQVNRVLVANNSSISHRNSENFDLNYRHTDKAGGEWNVDADYGRYQVRVNELQPNDYYDPTGKNLLYSNDYNMVMPTDINIYSIKSDYATNFAKGRLSFGAKVSYVTTSNDFVKYNVYSYGKIIDSSSTDDFSYKENINAGYIDYNRTLKGWVIEAGLRVENTNNTATSLGYRQANGNYGNYDSTFSRHYTDFFPSGSITYNKNPAQQWTLSYSRRIDRPAYQDLNPFLFQLDDYTYTQGNTQLRPQYSNSIGLTYMYQYKLTATLNYSHIDDMFTALVDTIQGTKTLYSKQNFTTQDITSLNISYPLQYKWYSLYANINTYYSLYKADFGPGRIVNVNVFATNLYAQQSAALGKGWTAEVIGLYNSPYLLLSTLRSGSMWSVDAGLQKSLMNNKAQLKISVSDIFNTLHWNAAGSFAGQYVYITGGYESRLFKMSFTYRGGSSQVKAARQRKAGDEEENNRIQ